MVLPTNVLIGVPHSDRQYQIDCVGDIPTQQTDTFNPVDASLTLPHDAKKDEIEARFDKGVLTICIAKDPMARENERQIEINATH